MRVPVAQIDIGGGRAAQRCVCVFCTPRRCVFAHARTHGRTCMWVYARVWTCLWFFLCTFLFALNILRAGGWCWWRDIRAIVCMCVCICVCVIMMHSARSSSIGHVLSSSSLFIRSMQKVLGQTKPLPAMFARTNRWGREKKKGSVRHQTSLASRNFSLMPFLSQLVHAPVQWSGVKRVIYAFQRSRHKG